MNERPDRRLAVRKRGGVVFGNTVAAKSLAGGAGGCVEARPQSVDDGNRHQFGDFAPVLPAMKTPQVVGAHDPDESDSRAACHQPRYRIVSVSRLNDSFETCDIDA